MALSIKNEEAARLALKVAETTGESMTMAVIVSLRERLERLTGSRKGPDLEKTLLAISQRCSQLPDLDHRPANEILGYDDVGLIRDKETSDGG